MAGTSGAFPHDKAGANWYWGINWFERLRETANHANLWDGYADSRDAAMTAFRQAWDAIQSIR